MCTTIHVMVAVQIPPPHRPSLSPPLHRPSLSPSPGSPPSPLQSWQVEEDGTPNTSSQQVCRSIVRYLKGHGTDYAFDGSTWAHYRRMKLTKMELFKVLKPFHEKSEKLMVGLKWIQTGSSQDVVWICGFIKHSE